MKKVVMGLSGGMDSTTLLGMLLAEGIEVHVCHFQYGSKHNPYEHKAIINILNYYSARKFPVTYNIFNLDIVFSQFQSNLLKHGGDIPEGHYESESMKLTVVPGRNTIFASIMMGLAESVGADAVALGVHSGDHHIYPDCRDSYIAALCKTVIEATDGKVQVIAPLLAEDKTSILKIGDSLPIPVPYHLTRTCYKDQEYSCGKCGSCTERLEAFENIQKIDPIKYEN
jgi:7-cyano-7-deazaguanine synthase